MHLYLGLPIYEQRLSMVSEGRGFPSEGYSAQGDSTISSLLDMLHDELTCASVPSEMYVRGLAQTLAFHLLRKYRDTNLAVTSKKGSLPTFKLQRVVRLMEAEMARQFDLQKLATDVGLSSFHFSRDFKQSTGTRLLHILSISKSARPGGSS
jgi:AraC family transcriptional regulator